MTTKKAVTKGLQQFVNPLHVPPITKSVRTQMLELHGKVEFGQGLYHNQQYENLIKYLTQSRAEFAAAVRDVNRRGALAQQQYQAWTQYVAARQKDLPENLKLTDKMQYQLNEIWDLVRDRKSKDIPASKMLEFHSEYTKQFRFDIPLDPRCLWQLIHPHLGYLTYFPGNLSLEKVTEIYNILLVATLERQLGQDLLANEISSLAYWQHFDAKANGYMPLEKFVDFLKIFRLTLPNAEVPTFENYFRFALQLHDGELIPGTPTAQQIIRFDFYRYLFLERNL